MRRYSEEEVDGEGLLKPPANFLTRMNLAAVLQEGTSEAAGLNPSPALFWLNGADIEQNSRLWELT